MDLGHLHVRSTPIYREEEGRRRVFRLCLRRGRLILPGRANSNRTGYFFLVWVSRIELLQRRRRLVFGTPIYPSRYVWRPDQRVRQRTILRGKQWVRDANPGIRVLQPELE